MCRDCFDSLSDRRSNERHEGAGKTAVSWVCELLYSQSRVGVVGSQLFRAAGNTANFISVASITDWQSVIKGLVGAPPISVSPPECLFVRFWLDFIAETFVG